MLVIFIITAICVVLIFRELKPAYKQDKKVFWVYTVILGFAYIVWCLNGLDVTIPNPGTLITDMTKAIYGVKGP
jgi:hypothetical protein